MQQNKNKQHTRTNYDYLNFIRRNQQIVEQFKQLSQTDKKNGEINRIFSKSIQPNKFTIETERYAEPLPIFQDSLVSYRPRARNFTNSMDLQPRHKPNMDELVKRRSEGVNRDNKVKINIYKDFKKRISESEAKNDSGIHQVSSQIRFPKLSSRLRSRDNSHTNSQSFFAANPQNKITIDSSKSTNNKSYDQISVNNSKSAQNQPRYRINNLKLEQLDKNKINNKVLKTYYQYENLVSELKERVSELTPTFKPIQPKKREKLEVPRKKKSPQLQKYLEANVIQQIGKKVVYSTMSIKEEELKIKIKELNQEKQVLSKTPIDQQPETKQQSQQKKNLNSVAVSPIKPKANAKKQIKYIQPQANNQQITVYHNKIASYRQFLFLINFSHRIFDPLVLVDDPQMHKCVQNKYRFYIGPGNNSLLVKSLMKRRFWWTQVDDPKEANFVWTQLKINSYYQFQHKCYFQDKYDKLDSDFELRDSKEKKLIKSRAKIDPNKKQEQNNKVGSILRGQLPEGQKKIFTKADNFYFSQMLIRATEENPSLKNFSKFQTRLKYLPQQFLQKREQDFSQIHMHNHFVSNFQIGNKKALFYNLKHYYELIGINPFNSIPLTFHIKKGVLDAEYAKFMKEYKKIKHDLQKAEKGSSKKKLSRNVWIVKPGQLSNRGNGITVIDEIYELNTILKSKGKHTNGTQKTYIVQKYIEKPMLYKNRKFDIRHYMMISRLHGRMRAYWFSEGYIRTSSYEYDLEQVGDVMIHLTNDAIQKHGESYGKYEEGNKLSYAEFQRYLDGTCPEKKYSFIEAIYPRMRQIATDAVKSTYLWMDPDQLEHNFEIFGLDFMIDANFNVWLIEVNTNPCLQLSSGLLGRIIPTMVENALRLALDPIFPPTAHYLNSNKYLAPDSPMERLQFELIFDESRDGKQIQQLLKKNGKADCGQIEEQDQTYENDGKEIDLGGDLQ